MNRIFLKICMLICLLSMVPTAMATISADDAYGYHYNDGVAYNWIDATDGTQILTNTDDGYIEVPIGFNFDFYGNTLTHVYVENNGFVGDVGVGFAAWTNTAFQSGLSDMIISPYWDDLLTNLNEDDKIYYKTIGTAPSRMFVVEWHVNNRFVNYETDASNYPYEDITFEAILYEGSNDIKFQYKDVDFGNVHYDNGASATVGIQGSSTTPDYFLKYSYNTPSLSDGMAILFSTHDYSTDIPEFPTIALPVMAVLGLMFLFQRRKVE